MKNSTSSTSENVLTVYKLFLLSGWCHGIQPVSGRVEKMMSAKSTSWKHGMFLLDSEQNLLASQGFSSVPDFSGVDLSTLTDGFHWEKGRSSFLSYLCDISTHLPILYGAAGSCFRHYSLLCTESAVAADHAAVYPVHYLPVLLSDHKG